MSISDKPKVGFGRVVLTLVVFVATIFATARCAPTDECLRISDCDEGLTCVLGECRRPEAAPPAPESEAGTPAEAGTTRDSSTPSPIDSGSTPVEAGTDASDSGSADASDD